MPDDSVGRITLFKVSTFLPSYTDLKNQLKQYHKIKRDSLSIDGTECRYRLYFYKQHPGTVTWYKLFRNLIHEGNGNIIPESLPNGFILIVNIVGSVYVLTGGISHHHLRKVAQLEHRFGVIMAQKLLKLPELKGLIQKDTSGVNYRLDRVFRGRYNPKGEIENLKRVLTKIRGKLSKDSPYYDVVGKGIDGNGDSLSVTGSKSFNDIISFVIKIDTMWRNNEVSLPIPQLEAIDKKVSPELLASLEKALVDQLCNYNESEDINLFLDNDEIGYLPDRAQSFQVLFRRYRHDVVDTFQEVFLKVRTILADIEDEERVDAFRRITIKIVFDDDTEMSELLCKFICGDIVWENDVYFLNNGYWYKASRDFVNSLDGEIDNIDYISPVNLGLLEWDMDRLGGMTETRYNEDNTEYCLLHEKLVRVPGERGGIEFCDLAKTTPETTYLVHVKHGCGAALRALFAQGCVASQFFSEDSVFQKKVYNNDLQGTNDSVEDYLKGLEGKRKKDFTVVFAIYDEKPSHCVPSDIIDTSKVLKGTLTPFAKADLLDRVGTIRSIGYHVAITRIRPYPVA